MDNSGIIYKLMEISADVDITYHIGIGPLGSYQLVQSFYSMLQQSNQ